MNLICGLEVGSKLEDCFVNQEDISLSWDQGGHFLVKVWTTCNEGVYYEGGRGVIQFYRFSLDIAHI